MQLSNDSWMVKAENIECCPDLSFITMLCDDLMQFLYVT